MAITPPDDNGEDSTGILSLEGRGVYPAAVVSIYSSMLA